MYAITGITGKVGGATAKTLLAAGHKVRAVLRDEQKAQTWREQGCDVALAEMHDIAALTAAFTGVDGVFILMPSNFDPIPGFPETHQLIANIIAAITAANPPKVVLLSTIGAQAVEPNLLNQLGAAEQAFAKLTMPVTVLRAAWFMENALWDVSTARDESVYRSFLQPLSQTFPMIATQDIGSLAAFLLTEASSGHRIVELEGPQRYTPRDVANAFALALKQDIATEVVPRDSWHDLFTSHGMKNPQPRMQMLDGFNQGWIEFATDAVLHGKTSLEQVIAQLVDQQR